MSSNTAPNSKLNKSTNKLFCPYCLEEVRKDSIMSDVYRHVNAVKETLDGSSWGGYGTHTYECYTAFGQSTIDGDFEAEGDGGEIIRIRISHGIY